MNINKYSCRARRVLSVAIRDGVANMDLKYLVCVMQKPSV